MPSHRESRQPSILQLSPGARYTNREARLFQWLLDITLLDQNHIRNVLVRDSGGKPFATTPAPGGGLQLNQAYSVMYSQCLYSDFKIKIFKNVPNGKWIRFK
jgi:hypothetical protein